MRSSHISVTPRLRRHSQLMAFLVVVLGILALGSWLGRVVPEPTLTITIPIGNQRSLILMAAYRAIADDPWDPLVPHAVQPTVHELRLGVGHDDRVRETYVQLLDLTVPLCPWWPEPGPPAGGRDDHWALAADGVIHSSDDVAGAPGTAAVPSSPCRSACGVAPCTRACVRVE